MIHTVTPNPAIDVTHELDSMLLGEVNRVRAVRDAPGGKGVNVARVIVALGRTVSVGGFLGGPSGQLLQQALEQQGIVQSWTAVQGHTRRTVTVVDDHGATVLNEPGPVLEERDWSRLQQALLSNLSPRDVVVLSGSTPPGTPEGAAATLVDAARGHGARVLVDTSGPTLLAVARAGAEVVKPNAAELREATGAEALLDGARQLVKCGAGAVVVSCGEEGMLAVVPEGGDVRAWRARPGSVLDGNPTGAGDAAVAALACALADQDPTTPLTSVLPEALREAVALSGAAVLRPVAGEVDVPAYRRMRHETTLEELHATR